MPKKKLHSIPRPDLLIERLPNGTEFVVLDLLTSEFLQVGTEFFLCLLTSHPEKPPRFGYIVPVQKSNKNYNLLLELERRTRNGLSTLDAEMPHLPDFVPAIQIWINANVHNGDFQTGGEVSIAHGALKNLTPLKDAEWRQRRYHEASWIPQQYGLPPASLLYEDWRGWRLLNGQWARDLWRWTKTGMTLPRAWEMLVNASHQDESVFTKIGSLFVQNEKQEKVSLLAAISLLFNHWEFKKLSLKQRTAHLDALRFSFKIDKGSLANWTAEAGCTPKSKSLLIRDLQACQKRAYEHFEQDPASYGEWKNRKRRHAIFAILNRSDDGNRQTNDECAIVIHIHRSHAGSSWGELNVHLWRETLCIPR